MVQHKLFVRFKPDVTELQIDHVCQSLAELAHSLSSIPAFRYGTNISPENLNKGLNHYFLLTFKDETERNRYLIHPGHKALQEVFDPMIDDIMVFDVMV
ncbi:hypothetical protein WH50_19250 [Pokkaliibacter plantistimulans]|uniref:Stress-response A/B barrel domain-containing protein n=2 Tax=Pseudomonadota TaxID=1224 RepID=A0ABX5LSS5_9GAMM|nr:Dabb family protein [Pokkaliibacter plantistimulans]PPC79369.1 hypothetical protein C4K68_00170 [Pokkaliibacter plantistimulans]PXF29710.1 hypothetical protein WH50_19250 [Pokkaliibacter plantistimulans]